LGAPSGNTNKHYKKVRDLSPAIGSPLHNWIANLMAFGPPSIRYIPRVLFVALVSFVGIPFRWYEQLRLGKKIRQTKLHSDPVFIMGHWRGGTTLIHNIITKDPQFGYITLIQALFPKSFKTTKFFHWFYRLVAPDTRPMDNMKLGEEFPQEDELALSNMMRYSLYNGWQFPWRLMTFYRNFVEFKGISDQGKKEWWADFDKLLKITTVNMDGKQLLLKNPPHTGRLKEILKHYPNAKFIHIYRNPYNVYGSTLNLYQKAVPQFVLQKYPVVKMKRDILQIYRKMMTSWFESEHLIPKGNLVSIKFEDLEQGILPAIEKAYSDLSLGGFDEAKPHFEKYIASLSTYKKNAYNIDQKTIDLIYLNWGFAIDKWAYKVPE
jgi:hypothetical protein